MDSQSRPAPHSQQNHLDQLAHLHLPPPAASPAFRLPPISPRGVGLPPASHHPSLSSPHPSPNDAWNVQRTSSVREDIKPFIHGTHSHQPLHQPHHGQHAHHHHPALAQMAPDAGGDDPMPPASDFVKKLYKMLQDNTYGDIVTWSGAGDCFVIRDMTEFTKTILPRMFKHSNFASFVRQLNKYDFHKVKNSDENSYGDHSWTFRHPDFQANRPDALENIKRKVPSQRKLTPNTAPSKSSAYQGDAGDSPSSPHRDAHALQAQIERLTRQNEEMDRRVRALEGNNQDLLSQMVTMHQTMVQSDGLLRNVIQYFMQMDFSKNKGESDPQLPPTENKFVPTSEAQRIMGGSYPETDVARATFAQMNEISRRATAGLQFATSSSRPGSPAVMAAAAAAGSANLQVRQEALQRIEELQKNGPGATPSTSPASSAAQAGRQSTSPMTDGSGTMQARTGTEGDLGFDGLQVFTVGHLLPRSSAPLDDGTWSFDPNAFQMPAGVPGDAPVTASAEDFTPVSARPATPQRLRVRRSTFVPGWAVPPRVLLVEDDDVSRRLSSKFLQVFGCTIDVAVDGVGAVHKMNLEKYDLVLMDIVMPKLDGVSATSLIRQFDPMTPIISMTSNSKPNEILTYYSHGMNDILPKPFTKEGLLDMLEKHLMHLKVIKEMAKVPRGLSIPPGQDASTSSSDSLMASASASVPVPEPMSGDDSRINPLAGLGLSDEQYAQILQTLVNGDAFAEQGAVKRGLELDDAHDPRDEKRSRFEVVD